MNLYEIMFRHYAPKDSEHGVHTYLVANNDEEVFDWIKEENSVWFKGEINDGLSDGNCLFLSWSYKDMTNDDCYEEGFRDRIIACKGDMFDDETELCDLYYGQTLAGWRLVKEDAKPDTLQLISDYGIRLCNTMK